MPLFSAPAAQRAPARQGVHATADLSVAAAAPNDPGAHDDRTEDKDKSINANTLIIHKQQQQTHARSKNTHTHTYTNTYTYTYTCINTMEKLSFTNQGYE